MFFSNLFKRCPRTGKIRGINKSAWPKWALMFAGSAACAWYLFRVIPKAFPRGVSLPARGRAHTDRIFDVLCRPCGICVLIRKGQVAFQEQKAFPGRPLFCGSIVSLFVFIASDARPALAANPIGTAKGIFPGRVAWVYNTNAAKWTGAGNYWDAAVNPQAEYNKSFTAGIAALSGGKNDADSWDKIFRWFNNATAALARAIRPAT